MNLRHILIGMFAAVAMVCSAQQAEERMFPYPEPPEELETLSERTGYLVEHFWERCQLPSAVLFKDKFRKAFNDWISFMPYAEADVVHSAIGRFLEKFKKEPDKLVTVAEIAEDILYNPNGEYISDEVYLPFAQAAATAKKVPADKKAHFAAQAAVLSASQVGMDAPEIVFTKPDGTKGKLSDLKGTYTLIFFDDPECDDCFMTRVKLSADANLNSLIEKGQMQVLYIYTGTPDDAWRSRAASMNPRWIVGAAPEVTKVYDMRNPPVFYYLNAKHSILSKSLVIDGLLEAFRQVNRKMQTPTVVTPTVVTPADADNE